jgi:hypothetical protein
MEHVNTPINEIVVMYQSKTIQMLVQGMLVCVRERTWIPVE